MFNYSNINSQTKFIPSLNKPDNFKVTEVINLDYKYVPSIRELIDNGTFIAADPEEYKKDGPPKRLMANKVVPGKGFPK